MATTPISVFIIALNEAEHIGEALASVQDFDEVIVVDSGSSDGTQGIAEQAGAKVMHQDWLGFAKQKAFAMQQCKNEWVLNLDADEVLNPALVQAIQSIVDKGDADAIRISFEDWFWGKPMSSRSRKRSIVRVYRQDAIEFPINRLVHENVRVLSGRKEVRVPGLVKHYGYGTTAVLMEKQNKYSSLKAEEKFRAGKSGSLLKLVLVFPFTFIKTYLFRGLVFSGRRGLVQASIEAMYALLKEAKLLEKQYGSNKD